MIYGDGGNAGYDATNSAWRFNEFTSAFTDANFENGAPTKWVIISAPLVNSGEAVGFYWPEIGDPNPPTGAHPIFSGLQHVWRSWAFGAGREPDRCATGQDARHRKLRGELPRVHDGRQPARVW